MARKDAGRSAGRGHRPSSDESAPTRIDRGIEALERVSAEKREITRLCEHDLVHRLEPPVANERDAEIAPHESAVGGEEPFMRLERLDPETAQDVFRKPRELGARVHDDVADRSPPRMATGDGNLDVDPERAHARIGMATAATGQCMDACYAGARRRATCQAGRSPADSTTAATSPRASRSSAVSPARCGGGSRASDSCCPCRSRVSTSSDGAVKLM